MNQAAPRLPHVSARQLASLRIFFSLLQKISPGLAAGAAFRLFLRTFRHPLRAEDAALLGLATSQRIATSTGSIMVHEWAGSGPTAFILHGWGSSAARFTLLARALNARGWRVLAFDAPGHGGSSGGSSSLPQFMAALDAVIERHGRPNALVGHSLGALAIANRHAGGAPAWASELRAVALVSMPSGAEYLIRKYIEALGISPTTEQRLVARFRERFEAEPRDYGSMPGAAHIAARLLLVHDQDDDIAPHAHSAQLAAQLPAARFITTVDQGHSKLTREATTIALIADFIEGAATP